MSQIKNPQQFAAIEYCLQHYFTEELAPVMKQVKDELNRKQVKELADYQRSPAGILAAANTGMVASPFDALTHVQLTSGTARPWKIICGCATPKSSRLPPFRKTLPSWQKNGVKRWLNR